ncbi:exocyst complex component Sec3 [Phlyctema vagabunda]|uniref:Exocyst complex component Sec3 n=1 Tax=Phlyctema vagabunda TaxID=108571 RepID=A0ABR4PL44_9HELO
MEVAARNGSGGAGGNNAASRAERFEDEKKRIIESCFGKRESDGSLSESYITHIRIIEDAAFPSSPPPPDSDPSAKKPRLIIVAVRKSGRVRMHKARENLNGSFSIGKTWMLDDLSAVESFSGSTPSNPEEEQKKQWAGGIGFIVTLGKPYYWQANSQKEKQFFIASLVKIYTKYTGGKIPTLIGFDGRERNQLLGAAATPQSAAPLPPPVPTSPGPIRSARRSPSREPPALRKQPSREAMQRPPPQIPPNGVFSSPATRPGMRPRRDESPADSFESAASNLQSQPNQPGFRKMGSPNPSQDSFAKSEDNGVPPRSRGGFNGPPPGPGRFQDRSNTPNSQRSNVPDGSFPGAREGPGAPNLPLASPPERRRPPMPNLGDSSISNGSNDNIVPAPLISPGMRRDDLRPPTRSSERTQTRSPASDSNVSPGDTSNPTLTDPITVPVVTPAPDRTFNLPAIDTKPPRSTPSPMTTSPVEMAPQVVPPEPEEETRPGLGPMIKQKSRGDIKGTFLAAAKAASAFQAFKPRAGGAADRLKNMPQKPAEGPDGITSVVPAPFLLRGMSSDSTTAVSPATTIEKAPSPSPKPDAIPEVKIIVPQSERPSSIQGSIKGLEESIEKPKPRDAKRPKPASDRIQKELASLGVDPSILNGRGTELINLWDDFGWTGEGVHTKNIDEMQVEIERELNKVQAGGWLARLNEEDERVEAIQKGLDICIAECEELEGLLTLYSVELGTLNDDIAYIEAQSQGLQVQTANQKLLQVELQNLLGTISISASQLRSLREASLESPRGLEDIEASLVMLFKAMVTIDPSLGQSGPRPSEDGSMQSGKPGGIGSSEIGSMRVLQEKKDVYRNETVDFLRRLKPFSQVKFAAAIDETRKALEREKGSSMTRAAGKAKLDPRNHDLSRNMLWRYSPLMLFCREVDRPEWEELLKMYERSAVSLYQDEFRDAVFAWKRIGRKPTGDEGEILFTSQAEKQAEGIATTARKLTVKRSQTLAKSLRSPIGDSSSKVDKSDTRLQPYEVFGGALDEMVPIVCMEQNFIVDFFHVTSLEQHDFPDLVSAALPDDRRGGDLRRPKVMEPNRDLSRLVVQSMEEIYTFFAPDMQALMDWSMQADPLQGIGVLAAIERKMVDLEETSQEYLSRSLQKLHSRLMGLFNKFLDEQIRAIEDTKVKIKKRKGVIAFIRIFPHFSLAIENMLASADGLDIRETVNRAYGRINKTMFESLKVIARENPSAQTAGTDPEDKEALNYQILLIENMNHYLEEVTTRSNPVLEEWKENASQEMNEHLSLYLGAVIRRPLGKLLDFLESTEALMLSRQPGESVSRISGMPSHSQTTFKKILDSYDSKEIKRGIETLKKRVEKHFGDADDPSLSRGLVAKVQQSCEKYYESVEDRILTISRDVYDGEVLAEWTKADVVSAFKK